MRVGLGSAFASARGIQDSCRATVYAACAASDLSRRRRRAAFPRAGCAGSAAAAKMRPIRFQLALSTRPLANRAGHTFLEQTVFEGEVSHDLLRRLRLAAKILHLVRRRGARRVAGEPFLVGFQKLRRPAVVHRRGDAPAATEFSDALLAAQPFQPDADLLLGRKVSTRRAPNECR